MPALEKLLERCDSHYHQSFKVYGLQEMTTAIVAALQALAPERELNRWFVQIVRDGTGKTFELEHNSRWLEVARPMIEAFFHARYFSRWAFGMARSWRRLRAGFRAAGLRFSTSTSSGESARRWDCESV